eukprot:5320831-Prymnesium_polylepis.1
MAFPARVPGQGQGQTRLLQSPCPVQMGCCSRARVQARRGRGRRRRRCGTSGVGASLARRQSDSVAPMCSWARFASTR